MTKIAGNRSPPVYQFRQGFPGFVRIDKDKKNRAP